MNNDNEVTDVDAMTVEITRLECAAQDAEDREQLAKASSLRAKARELTAQLLAVQS
jgi:hypothetical protein